METNRNSEHRIQRISQAIGLLLEDVEQEKNNIKYQNTRDDDKIDVDKIIDEYNNNILMMLDKERGIFLKSDRAFLKFLRHFVENQNTKEKQKQILKYWFFAIVMLGFLILISTPIVLIVSIKDMTQITAIISVLSILIELVVAIMVLPQIIAEYLFNKEEDKMMMQIIESMQQYNNAKHKYISKFENDKNK